MRRGAAGAASPREDAEASAGRSLLRQVLFSGHTTPGVDAREPAWRRRGDGSLAGHARAGLGRSAACGWGRALRGISRLGRSRTGPGRPQSRVAQCSGAGCPCGHRRGRSSIPGPTAAVSPVNGRCSVNRRGRGCHRRGRGRGGRGGRDRRGRGCGGRDRRGRGCGGRDRRGGDWLDRTDAGTESA
jgi:hypothetical protein